MSFEDFMNKVRYWDNMLAKWIMRHFYLLFFQIVLVFIFVIWFINTLSVLDVSFQMDKLSTLEKIVATQSANTSIIVLLLLFNSFWMLYMFSSMLRLKAIVRDMNFHLGKMRNRKDN